MIVPVKITSIERAKKQLWWYGNEEFLGQVYEVRIRGDQGRILVTLQNAENFYLAGDGYHGRAMNSLIERGHEKDEYGFYIHMEECQVIAPSNNEEAASYLLKNHS